MKLNVHNVQLLSKQSLIHQQKDLLQQFYYSVCKSPVERINNQVSTMDVDSRILAFCVTQACISLHETFRQPGCQQELIKGQRGYECLGPKAELTYSCFIWGKKKKAILQNPTSLDWDMKIILIFAWLGKEGQCLAKSSEF